MPVAVSYPGVYVEEISSGVRTITGVSTSLAAFVGRTTKGPVNQPVIINSQADFERQFGGLTANRPAANLPLAFAVRDFYLNGGSQAIIVRLFSGGSGTPAPINVPKLNLVASSPGSWANLLRVRVDTQVSPDVAALYGLTAADLFNLTIYDGSSGATESFVNLTVKDSPRRVDRVLANSALVRVASGFTLADVPDANAAPAAGKTVWTDDNASTPVASADQAKDSDALADSDYTGSQADKTGLYALLNTDLFNLLSIPPDTAGGDTSKAVYAAALAFCVKRRAILLVDPPAAWASANDIVKDNAQALTDLGLSGTDARNAALYFPRISESDPGLGNAIRDFPPSGAVAGLYARTDASRGVWKAPAGVDAALNGVQGVSVSLTNEENGQLNPLGVNCLRAFPVVGRVSWGSRTLRGADLLGDEYKYVPVRRTALYIEESLFRGLQWAVFEPNDEPLWAQIRLNVGAFMQNLFRQGAFQGSSPRDAYFVKCDKETTTQNDINLGIVNVVVGFAPLKPAEFVVIQLQQIAGQIQV